MPDTELDCGTWTKLVLITQRARREPQCQFTSLAYLLDERFLADCYHRLGRDRASGVDGVTWKEYGEHLEENLGGFGGPDEGEAVQAAASTPGLHSQR